MHRMAGVLFGFLLGILLVVPGAQRAFAQEAEDDSGLRANCVGDYFRFCSSHAPGTLAIRQCFGRNLQQLTPACRGAIQSFDKRKSKDKRG